MIVYDLVCASRHRFEGWFADSASFDDQQARGLVECPECGSDAVEKAPMAPAVGRKGNQLAPVQQPATPVTNRPLPPQAAELLARLAKMQAEVLAKSRYVGDEFVEDVRAMHYGEKPEELVHGTATLEDAQELADEGIEIAPLPFPVLPTDGSH